MEKQHNDSNDRMKVFTRDEEFPTTGNTGNGDFDEVESAERHDINRDVAHEGSEALVDRFNINDKANSDSSINDFITTTSNYHHADQADDLPENDSRH